MHRPDYANVIVADALVINKYQANAITVSRR